MPSPLEVRSGVVHLRVRVTPKASRNAIQGLELDADGVCRLKLQVTVVPEKGKANQAVVKLLSKQLSLAKSAFTLVEGETARNKCFALDADEEAVLTRLQALGVMAGPRE